MKTKDNEYVISDLLKEIFSRYELGDRLTEMDIIRTYRVIVGDLISKLTKEAKVKNKTLYLKISSAALKNELFYKKEDLVNRINRDLNCEALETIVFL
jgi:hypothetical protein